MMSERTTLARLAALCLALAPLPVALAYSETDLATLEETGSCSGCDLAGADLYEADLFQADLSLSDLSGADLTAADLTLANLRGVDLRGAILDETNLSGANLAKVLLDKNALAGAIFDSERTRTTLGFKDLKLGMNAVEVAQYCSITNIDGKASDLANLITSKTDTLEGACFDNADMPFAFKFSGGGTTGVLSFLKVGIAAYTDENHHKFIDLLAKKYEPVRSYTAADVAIFNKDRSRKNQSLDTIFANGQVTLSVVGEGAGLQMLLSYRDIEQGRRFLKLKGDLAPVDLAHLLPITTDLYKLVGNYKLKGIGAKGTNSNHGRIDTAYLEIDAFENELAGELVISGHGMSGRFRIIGIEKIFGNRLTVQLEPVTGTIPDGRPLRMSLEFSEDGNSFTGKWTNWFNKSRRPDDFKGSRSQSFWQTAMSHNRIDMYQAYLRLRPGGIYSAIARSRITALGGTLPAPSAPTVSVAASTSPSTPTTTITTTTTATTVDPLVGIWHWKASAWTSVDHCYLAIGMGDDGELKAKGWETHRKGDVDGTMEQIIEYGAGRAIVGMRDLAITRTADQAYLWRSDKRLPTFSPGTGAGGAFLAPDMAGRLALEAEQTSLYANSRVCRKPKIEPAPGTYQKLTLEEALALELPPELLQDFPSPFATEGPQVASVPKASATVSPSTPTPATTAPVDPLVGVWVRTGSDIAWTNECWLLVGQTEDGILIGKAQDSTRKHRGNFSDKGKNIHLQDGYAFGLKEISFERQSKINYLWSSKSNPFKSASSIDPAMSGRISIQLNEQGSDYLVSKGLLCRKRQSQSPAKFRRLTIAEALELTLHPDLLKDFPSPFATEGPQVASVPKATASAIPTSVIPTTTTTTATAVDPLVGVWRYKPAGAELTAHLIVGMDDRGGLAGFQWHSSDTQALTYGFREISIESLSDGSYSWHTDQPVSIPVNLTWPLRDAVKEGKFWPDEAKADLSAITSSKALFATSAGHSDRQPLKKLSYEEAVSLKLPPQVPKDFPSPFATEGKQVVSVPKANASASATPSATTTTTATTATAVDPLVGIWHWQGGVFGNIDHCYIAVGMHPNGDLEAKAWETHRIDDLKGPFISEFIEGSSIVGLRDLVIQKRLDKTYAWESTTEVPGVNEGAAGNIWVAPAMSGVLKIRTGAAGINVETNNRVCRKITADPVSGAFRRVPTEEALALELPPELLEGFPSPFQEGTQWSGDLATEITGAAQTTGATPDSNDSDQR